MSVIRRSDDSRLTIETAKALIAGALPHESGIDVYMCVNADGQIDFDGPIELKDEGSNMYAGGQLAETFKEASKQGLITPRFKYRPTMTGYTGIGDEDSTYTISHADFVALAGLYGIRVEVRDGALVQTQSQAPESQAAPVVAERASNAPKFKRAALIAAHVHEWPTIARDIADAQVNGLAAAKAGERGWVESVAMNWARANGKLIAAAKGADSLAQAMHNMGNLPSRKHTIQG